MMVDKQKVIKGLECCAYKKNCNGCPYFKGNATCMDDKDKDALELLKEQESVVRCKDCVHWIPGEITDKDDFIQPRCRRNGGGWASDDYCSCAERREAACTSNCTS